MTKKRDILFIKLCIRNGILLAIWLGLFIFFCNAFVKYDGSAYVPINAFAKYHFNNIFFYFFLEPKRGFAIGMFFILLVFLVLTIGAAIFFSIKKKSKEMIVPSIFLFLDILVLYEFTSNLTIDPVEMGYVYLFRAACRGNNILLAFLLIVLFILIGLNLLFGLGIFGYKFYKFMRPKKEETITEENVKIMYVEKEKEEVKKEVIKEAPLPEPIVITKVEEKIVYITKPSGTKSTNKKEIKEQKEAPVIKSTGKTSFLVKKNEDKKEDVPSFINPIFKEKK